MRTRSIHILLLMLALAGWQSLSAASAAEPTAQYTLLSQPVVACPQATAPNALPTGIWMEMMSESSHTATAADYGHSDFSQGSSSGAVLSGSASYAPRLQGGAGGGFYSTSSMLSPRTPLGDRAQGISIAAETTPAIRRIPADPLDPFLNPIGDMPALLLLLLIAGYIGVRYMQRRRAKH